MGHAVNIDPDAIDNAFAQFEAGSSPVTGTDVVMADEAESGWLGMAGIAADLLANVVTPNWNVPQEKREEWASALADCLDELMPGGLGNLGDWGPWAKLAFASGSWALCGFDFETMRLRPLRPPVEPAAAPDGVAGEGRGAAVTTNGQPTGPVTTSTGES